MKRRKKNRAGLIISTILLLAAMAAFTLYSRPFVELAQQIAAALI